MAYRKIIQLAAMPYSEDNGYEELFALCDDGTVWCWCMGKWEFIITEKVTETEEPYEE
jgi:hypothetical protein